MKKLSQKGFSAVEVLLLVLVFGLIAGVGYYVYSQNKDAKTEDTQTASQAAEPTEQVAEIPSSIPEGWKKHTYPDTGFRFYIPADWKKETTASTEASYVSADYKAATDLGPSVKAGYWLEVYKYNTDEEHIEKDYAELLKSKQDIKKEAACGGDFEEITVAGQPAIRDNFKCHGTHEQVTLFFGKDKYMLRFSSLDEQDKESRELFANILGTVALEP